MIFWNWTIGVGIGTAVLLYLLGWQHASLHSQALFSRPWRIISFILAVWLVIIALFSPLQTLATQYFSLHVLQRLLLVAVVPALFFSGNPLPIIFAGLPLNIQTVLTQLPRRVPRLYHLFSQLTRPVPIWFLFVSTFWLWHDVQINRWLLQVSWLHRLESITLLATAAFYWWHIMAASPRLRPAMPLLWRVAYAALGATPIKLVGFVLLFTTTAVYQYPAEISFSGIEMNDQSLGAAIVWVVGGIVFTWTAVMLLRGWLQDEENKPALPESIWSAKEMMLAPGFNKSSLLK